MAISHNDRFIKTKLFRNRLPFFLSGVHPHHGRRTTRRQIHQKERNHRYDENQYYALAKTPCSKFKHPTTSLFEISWRDSLLRISPESISRLTVSSIPRSTIH